ncbi:MAG TPA: DUF2232 domain-containing protein [Geminicoccaceae bacterium]|nr:DUF2232 domain-containing protein [Geminicoccaceae bacterium]
MQQTLGLAILAGVASSALFLCLLTGVPGMVLFAYFVQLPLMFAGLAMGLTASMVAVAGALLINGLIAGAVATAIYGLIQALPALVVVRQALLSRRQDEATEWYPPGLLLAQLTCLAGLGIGVAFVLLFDHPGGLQGAIEEFLAAALAEIGAIEAEAVPSSELNSWMFLFPGLMATSWLVMIVLNAVLAQALAVRLGWNRRPSPDLSGLELPSWLWPALGAAAAVALLGDQGWGFLGRSLLIVFTVPYVFLGLAVIHTLVRRWSHPGWLLAAVYGALVLLGWPILAVLLLGFVEDWAHLRRRLV